MPIVTKLIIRDDNNVNKHYATYESQLIPMINDLIDVPKIGMKEVVKRVFDVEKPNEVILFVR